MEYQSIGTETRYVPTFRGRERREGREDTHCLRNWFPKTIKPASHPVPVLNYLISGDTQDRRTVE